MDLGNKILKLRKNSNLSQEQLAEKMGVSRQTISKWELGETAPDIKQAQKLSKLFNISLDELVGNDVENVLIEKVSNTEKLAGLIIKILKFIGIAFLVILVIDIITFIFFIPYKNKNKTILTTEISCTLHDNHYLYEVTYYEDSGEIIEAGGDSYLDNITDAEKYSNGYKVIDIIDAYVKNNGGSCKVKEVKRK